MIARWLCVLMTLGFLMAAGAPAGEKERLLFRPKPAADYPARDAHDGIIIAAEPFDTPEETKAVFGKNDPLKVGILPILLVLENSTDKALRLDDLSVRFITRDRQNLEPTPAEYVAARLKKKTDYPRDAVPSPIPRIPRVPSSNGKGIEVLVHAFNLRMIPPKSSASGFFYFETGRRGNWLSGATLLLNQIVWASNAQPLLYFEISLDKALNTPPTGRE